MHSSQIFWVTEMVSKTRRALVIPFCFYCIFPSVMIQLQLQFPITQQIWADLLWVWDKHLIKKTIDRFIIGIGLVLWLIITLERIG